MVIDGNKKPKTEWHVPQDEVQLEDVFDFDPDEQPDYDPEEQPMENDIDEKEEDDDDDDVTINGTWNRPDKTAACKSGHENAQHVHHAGTNFKSDDEHLCAFDNPDKITHAAFKGVSRHNKGFRAQAMVKGVSSRKGFTAAAEAALWCDQVALGSPICVNVSFFHRAVSPCFQAIVPTFGKKGTCGMEAAPSQLLPISG